MDGDATSGDDDEHARAEEIASHLRTGDLHLLVRIPGSEHFFPLSVCEACCSRKKKKKENFQFISLREQQIHTNSELLWCTALVRFDLLLSFITLLSTEYFECAWFRLERGVHGIL